MAGIVMDTATFAHPNATPRTLVVSAALVEAGAPLSDISRRLYRTKPDAQLRLFGVVLDRLQSADDGRIVWSSVDRRRHRRDGRPARRTPKGSSTCSPRPRTAEVAILFKEAGRQTRISVRTRPGGVDATVLTGRFGGGGHARAAGAHRSSCGSTTPTRRPRRGDAPRRRASALTMARSSLGPGLDGILVVAKPAGPTSHDVVALVRRLAATKRVGHGGTLDPFASGVLPVFLGHATRVVEYHLGDRKAYRATICFGASSTTDDLEGELTPPRVRPRRVTPSSRHSPSSPAPSRSGPGIQRDQGRRPPRVRDGAGGRDRRARPARGHDPRVDLARGMTRTPTGRSRSSTSRARPARTSGRSLATSARRWAVPPTSAR